MPRWQGRASSQSSSSALLGPERLQCYRSPCYILSEFQQKLLFALSAGAKVDQVWLPMDRMLLLFACAVSLRCLAVASRSSRTPLEPRRDPCRPVAQLRASARNYFCTPPLGGPCQVAGQPCQWQIAYAGPLDIGAP